MRALVLSGGGAKGAYEAGALKHLLGDLKVKYDIVCGVSVGAINATGIAQFPIGEEDKALSNLEKFWNTITTDQVYKRWFPFGRLHALWEPSLYNSANLQTYLDAHIDPKAVLASGRKLRIGATNITTGDYTVFNEDFHALSKAVYASAAYPLAFLPIEIDNNYYLDGGLKQITPLKPAIAAGADQIDVIMTFKSAENVFVYNKPNLLTIGERGLALMNDQIALADISAANQINNLLAQGIKIEGKRMLDIKIIRPTIDLGDSLTFDQSNIQPMFKTGYEDAIKMYK